MSRQNFPIFPNFGFAPPQNQIDTNRRRLPFSQSNSPSPSPPLVAQPTPLNAAHAQQAYFQQFSARTPSPLLHQMPASAESPFWPGMHSSRLSSPLYRYPNPQSASRSPLSPYHLNFGNSPGNYRRSESPDWLTMALDQSRNSQHGSPMQICTPSRPASSPVMPSRVATPFELQSSRPPSPAFDIHGRYTPTQAGPSRPSGSSSPLFVPSRGASPALSPSSHELQQLLLTHFASGHLASDHLSEHHQSDVGYAPAQHHLQQVPVANMLASRFNPAAQARESQSIEHYREVVKDCNDRLQLVLQEKESDNEKRKEIKHMVENDSQLQLALADYAPHLFKSIAYYLDHRNSTDDMGQLSKFSNNQPKQVSSRQASKRPATSENSAESILRSIPLCRALFETLTGVSGSFDEVIEREDFMNRFLKTLQMRDSANANPKCMACDYSTSSEKTILTAATMRNKLSVHQNRTKQSQQEADRILEVPLHLQGRLGPLVYPACWRFYFQRIVPLGLEEMKQEGLVSRSNRGALFANENGARLCPGCQRYIHSNQYLRHATEHFMHCNTGYCPAVLLNNIHQIINTYANLPPVCDCGVRFPAGQLIGYKPESKLCKLCAEDVSYNSNGENKHQAAQSRAVAIHAPAEIQALDSELNASDGATRISLYCLHRLALRYLPRHDVDQDAVKDKRRVPLFEMELPITRHRIAESTKGTTAYFKNALNKMLGDHTYHDIIVVILKCSLAAQQHERERFSTAPHVTSKSALLQYAERHHLTLPPDNWWQNHAEAEDAQTVDRRAAASPAVSTSTQVSTPLRRSARITNLNQ